MLETKNHQFKSIHLDVFYSDELITRDELQIIKEKLNPFDVSFNFDILGGVGGPIPAPIDLENILTFSFKQIIEGILSAFIYDIIKKLVTDIVFRLKQKEEKIPVLLTKYNENVVFFFDPKNTSKEEIDFYMRFFLRDSFIRCDDYMNGDDDVNFNDNEGEGKG